MARSRRECYLGSLTGGDGAVETIKLAGLASCRSIGRPVRLSLVKARVDSLLHLPQARYAGGKLGAAAYMHRVYFDSNEGPTGHDRYGLWLDASREDLARIPGGPREGMHVIIYMTGELEMEAVLVFDPDWNAWMARPIEGTTKYA